LDSKVCVQEKLCQRDQLATCRRINYLSQMSAGLRHATAVIALTACNNSVQTA